MYTQYLRARQGESMWKLENMDVLTPRMKSLERSEKGRHGWRVFARRGVARPAVQLRAGVQVLGSGTRWHCVLLALRCRAEFFCAHIRAALHATRNWHRHRCMAGFQWEKKEKRQKHNTWWRYYIDIYCIRVLYIWYVLCSSRGTPGSRRRARMANRRFVRNFAQQRM